MKKILLAMATMMTMIGCNNGPKQGIGVKPENLDTSAVAQNDFYQFACGGWMKNNPLPDEYSRFGSFDQLGLQNLEQVNGLIQELGAEEHEAGSVAQKIGDLYNMALDTARRNAEGIMPTAHTMSVIARVEDRAEWSRILGESMEFGLFALYVDADAMNSTMNILNEAQAGYALGEREYYLENDENTKRIRAEYLKHVQRMFELYGFDKAAQRAKTVLRMETRLAKAARSNVELRDPVANYNKMSIAELQALVPEIDWKVYLEAMGAMTDSINIGQPEHLQEVGKMLAKEKMEDLKTLFMWQVIDGSSSYLSDDIYAEAFHFGGEILSGRKEQTPLWKRAVGIVNGTLGEAVGEMYVERYFPQENKDRMIALVRNLQKALGERIMALDWMSDETKARAIEKLDAFTIKIGYPDTWRDYTDLDIDPKQPYYTNLLRAAKFEQAYSLSYLDKPVDKTKWYMTPQTVNAYYNPSANEIVFPAGILQYPFFDMSADDAFNYGAIGVVIGHEMTHGFDDQGCQFDKDGNLNNWWTEEDKARFDANTAKLAAHFDSIEVAPGVHANGEFTLGENIADHGGLQVSFQAFLNVCREAGIDPYKQDGKSEYTPAQRFFLAYANVWAGNIRDEEILVRTKSDPHSLGRWRVNGALPEVGRWYEAWGVTEESPLYRAEEERVKIW